MKEKTFKVEEKVRDEIQQASMDTACYERLVGFAMSNSTYNIPQEKVDLLIAKYNESFKKYETAKEIITKKVMKDYSNDATWALDFETCIVTVTYE